MCSWSCCALCREGTEHGFPTSIVFKENPGGEFRKSYHGYPSGKCYISDDDFYKEAHFDSDSFHRSDIDFTNDYDMCDATMAIKWWGCWISLNPTGSCWISLDCIGLHWIPQALPNWSTHPASGWLSQCRWRQDQMIIHLFVPSIGSIAYFGWW